MKMKHRLSHGYPFTSTEIVWDVAKVHILELEEAVTQIKKEMSQN